MTPKEQVYNILDTMDQMPFGGAAKLKLRRIVDKYYADTDKLVDAVNETLSNVDSEPLGWCECEGDTLMDSYYVPDGKDPRCHKHHYKCIECDQITQIG